MLEKYEDITDDIDTSTREVVDVEWTCPKCKLHIRKCDADEGEYNIGICPKCGYTVKFYIRDWM